MRMVIIPLDGPQATNAVPPYVDLIASGNGATLYLLTVVQQEEEASQVGDAFTYLEEKAGELRSRSLSCSTDMAGGIDVQVILAEARAKEADLIAISTHGRSGVNRWVMASVADGAVRRSLPSCLLVRPEQASGEEQ